METFSQAPRVDDESPLDHRIAALAARQRGVVSRLQLLGLGATPADIAGRVSRGTLHRIANSVYAVGHPGLGRGGRAQATLLQLPTTSGLSFDSAARWWEMKGRDPSGLIHVSVAGRGSFEPPSGVKLHFPRNLTRADIAVDRGLRVLSPERTILDLMRGDSVAELTRMLEQLVTTQRRTPDQLYAWGPGAARHRPGGSKLVEALDWVAGPAVIRSEFERLFRSFCQERGLPQPVTNHRLAGWELDAAWLRHGVAVELDSWRFHGGRWQFHQDRRKGLAISKAGLELVRLTWWQLKREQDHVHDAILAALQRGARRNPAVLSEPWS